jgi:peptidoglycan hydrolase CwlO-like protein
MILKKSKDSTLKKHQWTVKKLQKKIEKLEKDVERQATALIEKDKEIDL